MRSRPRQRKYSALYFLVPFLQSVVEFLRGLRHQPCHLLGNVSMAGYFDESGHHQCFYEFAFESGVSVKGLGAINAKLGRTAWRLGRTSSTISKSIETAPMNESDPLYQNRKPRWPRARLEAMRPEGSSLVVSSRSGTLNPKP
jgi:hypothetical protein